LGEILQLSLLVFHGYVLPLEASGEKDDTGTVAVANIARQRMESRIPLGVS